MRRKTDFLVIGSGIAGLTYALKVAAYGKVIIITKANEDESNTKYAQGGIAVVSNAPDTYEKHIADTMHCGGGLCDEKIVRLVITEATDRIKEIISWGAEFDKTAGGKFDLAREGGHSENRVIHHKDNTGSEPEKKLLGEILLKRNVISQEQLTHALKVQKEEDGYIGEILVRLGFLEERDIVVALIVQCNVPYIAIDKYEIELSILQLIPKETAFKHFVIPLDRVGDVLSVVMSDPLNVSVKAELQRLTNCQIAPFIATKKEIEKALGRWFGQEH